MESSSSSMLLIVLIDTASKSISTRSYSVSSGSSPKDADLVGSVYINTQEKNLSQMPTLLTLKVIEQNKVLCNTNIAVKTFYHIRNRSVLNYTFYVFTHKILL